ncbi:MAG: hypothetical protein F6K34_29810 [Okeania sp. SIO4D6]|nr:hypothetical protein [Okeania sp. SIO4D6]
MGRWGPTPNPSQEGNLGRWGDGGMGRWGSRERFGNGVEMEHFLLPSCTGVSVSYASANGRLPLLPTRYSLLPVQIKLNGQK